MGRRSTNPSNEAWPHVEAASEKLTGKVDEGLRNGLLAGTK